MSMAQIEQLSSMSNSSTGIFEFIKTYYPEYVGDKEYPLSESVFSHKKTDDHWVLSNISAAPLVVEGVNFRNSEHLSEGQLHRRIAGRQDRYGLLKA